MEEVGVFVRVYNVKPYLDRCISSVLSQTCSRFAFYIVDNGCTDGSSEILERYAAADNRIRLTRYEKNNPNTYVFYKFIQESDHPYLAVLDSDDWWEPDYLERLLRFMRENDLDLSMTGVVNHFEETHTSRAEPKLERPVVMTQRQFAENYPIYWVFPSTYWGNIMKSSLYKRVNLKAACDQVPGYGQDTGVMLHYLAQCGRIGIDDSALYHYRIRPNSVSYQYMPTRFNANVGYATEIRSFLEKNNAFDEKKREWLRRVHLSSIRATMEVAHGSSLPPASKLQECARIASHPLTADALRCQASENVQFRTLMREMIQAFPDEVWHERFEDVKKVVDALAPSCAELVTEEIFPLFCRKPDLMDMLLQDRRDELAKSMLNFISEKRYIKQYDLGAALGRLAGGDSLLGEINDMGFIRNYQDIYWKIWVNRLESALEAMTGLLLEDGVKAAKETFLQLYLSVAAVQNEISAFLFGNVKLAEYYLQKRRLEECGAVLADLEEMGMSESEELSVIRMKLDQEKRRDSKN